MSDKTEPGVVLEWDTNFFGRRIGRWNAKRLTPSGLAELDAWRRANSVECLYFLAGADDRDTVALAEENGFHLVEVRLLYERKLSSWDPERRPCEAPQVSVRPSRPEDVPALQEIAKNAYTGSRFYFDRRFSEEQWQAYYRCWIQKSVNGGADLALTAELDGEIVGYITGLVDKDKNEGIYELTGVRDDARRHGVGQELFRSGIDWFVRQGIPYMWLATQGRNVPTQRMVQRDGFVTRACQLYYHKWYA
jgi:dTDP-4-amino-4,6-dideoxy-D-galactose acyltransferase